MKMYIPTTGSTIMPLDHYRTLGRSGLRVSPFALGAMTFGEDPGGAGSDVEESEKILGTYLDRGGNFIDTANFYTNGHSESSDICLREQNLGQNSRAETWAASWLVRFRSLQQRTRLEGNGALAQYILSGKSQAIGSHGKSRADRHGLASKIRSSGFEGGQVADVLPRGVAG